MDLRQGGRGLTLLTCAGQGSVPWLVLLPPRPHHSWGTAGTLDFQHPTALATHHKGLKLTSAATFSKAQGPHSRSRGMSTHQERGFTPCVPSPPLPLLRITWHILVLCPELTCSPVFYPEGLCPCTWVPTDTLSSRRAMPAI